MTHALVVLFTCFKFMSATDIKDSIVQPSLGWVGGGRMGSEILHFPVYFENYI